MNAMFTSKPIPARSLDDLPFAERLVLWAMRMWGAGYRLGHSPDDVLARTFEKAGMLRGRQCLEEFMTALSAGAARSIGLQCVCSKGLSDDERLLLDTLRLSQPHFTGGQATFLLEDLVTLTAISITAVKAQALALAFNAANLHFPLRGEGATVSQFSRTIASAGPPH